MFLACTRKALMIMFFHSVHNTKFDFFVLIFFESVTAEVDLRYSARVIMNASQMDLCCLRLC